MDDDNKSELNSTSHQKNINHKKREMRVRQRKGSWPAHSDRRALDAVRADWTGLTLYVYLPLFSVITLSRNKSIVKQNKLCDAYIYIDTVIILLSSTYISIFVYLYMYIGTLRPSHTYKASNLFRCSRSTTRQGLSRTLPWSREQEASCCYISCL